MSKNITRHIIQTAMPIVKWRCIVVFVLSTHAHKHTVFAPWRHDLSQQQLIWTQHIIPYRCLLNIIANTCITMYSNNFESKMLLWLANTPIFKRCLITNMFTNGSAPLHLRNISIGPWHCLQSLFQLVYIAEHRLQKIKFYNEKRQPLIRAELLITWMYITGL